MIWFKSNADFGSLKNYVSLCNRKCYVIPVASACNARCSFCATESYSPKSERELMSLSSNLLKVTHLLYQAGVRRFEVTGGGEPTLHPKLEKIVYAIRVLGQVSVKLYTNAAKLPPNFGFDELNISRVSLDSSINQKIMRITRGTENIWKTVEKARRLGYSRIRISVPIMVGAVSTLPQAIQFVELIATDVDGIVFRPLYPATPDRAVLSPTDSVDPGNWLMSLRDAANSKNKNCDIEVDSMGCFRSAQLILASNERLYRDWSLSSEIKPVLWEFALLATD
jgi:MoaA/NifB/PqqE/SkfB family radical SAM enzyme